LRKERKKGERRKKGETSLNSSNSSPERKIVERRRAGEELSNRGTF